MYKAKYVIVNGSAIVFSAVITHKSMVGWGDTCEGAGFVSFSAKVNEHGHVIPTADVYGKSVSLGISSREKDALIISQQILLQ